jgi:hypothetical protein
MGRVGPGRVPLTMPAHFQKYDLVFLFPLLIGNKNALRIV